MAKIYRILWTFTLLTLCDTSFGKSAAEDRVAIAELLDECSKNVEYLVGSKYDVNCNTMYQHYNSSSSRQYSNSLAVANGKLRISGFNLWHPGNQNTSFKDYGLIAKIINKSDITAALELLPLVSLDAKNNRSVVGLLESGPHELRSLKQELKKLSSREDTNKVRTLKSKIEVLNNTLKMAPSVYRSPGYLKVLDELRKLDSSWSLILSPRGDAAKPTHVKELTGFYYRGRVVKPVVNEHCQETYSSTSGEKYACFPDLSESFMGRETTHIFSRRPLLASFKSGKFDFSILSSHVVFGSPHPVDNREDMENILIPSFGVLDYKELGVGVDSTSYARFAETKIILEFMNKLKKKYKEKDVMYIGDMNLSSDNQFWSELLEMTGGHKLLIDVETSVSIARVDSRGIPTHASASNYDHFIVPKNSFTNCKKPNGAYDTFRLPFLEGDVYRYVSDKYIVRSKRLKSMSKNFEEIYPEDFEEEQPYVPTIDYQMTRAGERKMEDLVSRLEASLNEVYTIKRGLIVKDDLRNQQKIEYYRDRVFLSQLSDNTFYRVYKEVISDHYPIFMNCSNR